MADAGTVTAAFAVTAAVSAYYQISKKHDPFPVLMASALGYGATAMVGQFLDWQLAATIAAVICLGVVIYRGRTIIDGFTSLINSKPATGSSNG